MLAGLRCSRRRFEPADTGVAGRRTRRPGRRRRRAGGHRRAAGAGDRRRARRAARRRRLRAPSSTSIGSPRWRRAARRASSRCPRFPSIVRDVSLLVPDTLSAATVRDTMRAAAPPTLVARPRVRSISGQGTPPGTVSVSLRFTFRAADRTLTDDEVAAALQRMVAAAGSSGRAAAIARTGRTTMAKTMRAGAGVGVEPFDRLEEKVKLLVSTIARLKGEQTRLADENTRLQRELSSLQDRVQQAEHAGSRAAVAARGARPRSAPGSATCWPSSTP